MPITPLLPTKRAFIGSYWLSQLTPYFIFLVASSRISNKLTTTSSFPSSLALRKLLEKEDFIYVAD